MKSYNIKNLTNIPLQVSAKRIASKLDVQYRLKPGESIIIYEEQLSGDINLKVNKRLLSMVETERVQVTSSFIPEKVELESEQPKPLSTRGRKKKII